MGKEYINGRLRVRPLAGNWDAFSMCEGVPGTLPEEFLVKDEVLILP